MKTISKTLFALFVLSLITADLCASYNRKEKEMYLLLLNIDDATYQQKVQNYFTELADSMKFSLPTEGLQLGKIESLPENSAFFSQLDFVRDGDSKNLNKQITGAIRGNLCRNDISKKAYFFVMNREPICSFEVGDYSNKSLEELKLQLGRYLNEIRMSMDNDQKPLLFVKCK